MLAAASSLFARSQIYQSYAVNTTPIPGSASSGGGDLPSVHIIPPFFVGLWKVQTGYHKTTNKRVSVWAFDKRHPELERLAASAKEHIYATLRQDAQALRKMRHPCILEMTEQLEETRSELIFATEPLLSSLAGCIRTSSAVKPSVELDEIEIQRGILQVAKALMFLHDSAKMVHTNVNPYSVLVNASGDWKLAGLAFTVPLQQVDGSATQWQYPGSDSRMPTSVQRDFDYLAPEYAIDEQVTTMSDMYSLGCLLHAVHMGGATPYKNHGSLSSMRQNAQKPLTGIGKLDPDLQNLLRSLITRHPSNRLPPSSLAGSSFFSSLPVSTLNFLDRSTFAAKPREEKIAFMKGLTGVLDRFSDGLKQRKLLPSLLEEMKDVNLISAILPNIFAISASLSASQFTSLVLPDLKPLFSMKDPPHNVLTLLENLRLLQEKTQKTVFKDQILPLVYYALDSEHIAVQERALLCVPGLCETIDYAEVQGVLFPKVAIVFTKTRVLSVKVCTLQCFLSMVNTLDQASLTSKLVPLLSKIRTRLATLDVQEAMGLKVDREAVATLVLPQLWTLSMGPMLNLQQYSRFMTAIRKLSERVEKEHLQYLRDHHRIEDVPNAAGGNVQLMPDFDPNSTTFENLVNRTQNRSDNVTETTSSTWEDDVWGSLLTPQTPGLQTGAVPQQLSIPAPQTKGSPLQTSFVKPSQGGITPSLTPSSQPRNNLSFNRPPFQSAAKSTDSNGSSWPTTDTRSFAPVGYMNSTSKPFTSQHTTTMSSTQKIQPAQQHLQPSNLQPSNLQAVLTPTRTRTVENSKPAGYDLARDFDPLV